VTSDDADAAGSGAFEPREDEGTTLILPDKRADEVIE